MVQTEIEEIGQSAGIIYRELQANGPMSVAELKKVKNLTEKDVQRALGWLAREGNISFELQGRVTKVQLCEA